MIKSNVFAIGTTACWSGCLYEINPEIAWIAPANEGNFDRTSDDYKYEQEIE